MSVYNRDLISIMRLQIFYPNLWFHFTRARHFSFLKKLFQHHYVPNTVVKSNVIIASIFVAILFYFVHNNIL